MLPDVIALTATQHQEAMQHLPLLSDLLPQQQQQQDRHQPEQLLQEAGQDQQQEFLVEDVLEMLMKQEGT